MNEQEYSENPTELVKIIKELKEKNDLFEKIINNLQTGIQVFDKNGTSFLINEKQKELLGLPDIETGIGKFNVLTDPYAKKNGAAKIYKRVYAGNECQQIFEYNFGIDENSWDTRKDKRVFNERIIPLCSKNGNVEYVVAYLSDETQKLESEKKLKESESHHKDFVNHSPDIMYKFSNKRGALFWSNRVKDILGYEPDELKQDPFLWNRSIHPEDKPKVYSAIQDYEKGEQYSVEYRIKTRSDEWVWLHDYFMFKKQVGDEVVIEGHAADITKRKKLELELEKYKNRFELAMIATKDGLWDWKIPGDEVYYSPGWKKMLGYDENELPNKFSVWEELTHPEDLIKAKTILNEHIEGKRERFDIEFRMQHKEGHWVDILSRANVFFDDNGEAYRLVGTHVDITERKQIKKALADSELRWKFAVEGNKDGLWDWNLITNEVYFSTQWKKMLGFEEHEISGSLEEWDRRVHPDDKEQTYKDINLHINGEVEFYRNEHRVLCKDGSYKWILDRGVIIEKDDKGKPIRMIGTHTDISERKKAQQAIKESQIKFKTIFDILDVGLIITNEEGKIIDCNKASEVILDITKEEHLNRRCKSDVWNVIRPDNTPMPPDEFAGVSALRENKTILNVEMGIERKDGVRWISSSATPLNLKGYGVLIAYIDITSLKDNEKKLIELNATKDKLFSIIAHDLRSPFSGLIGLSTRALEIIQSKNVDTLERYLSLINKSSQYSLSLLDNLLQWARIQTGRFSFNPEVIDVEDLINTVLKYLEPSYLEKNIKVNIAIEPYLKHEADKLMLETVIRNIIVNSIKFTQRDGEVNIVAVKFKNELEITVEDNGVGMSREQINNLFKIEKSFSTPGTNAEKGTGLGLVLCKEFVEQHNGKIWVESEKGKWTKFSFTI